MAPETPFAHEDPTKDDCQLTIQRLFGLDLASLLPSSCAAEFTYPHHYASPVREYYSWKRKSPPSPNLGIWVDAYSCQGVGFTQPGSHWCLCLFDVALEERRIFRIAWESDLLQDPVTGAVSGRTAAEPAVEIILTRPEALKLGLEPTPSHIARLTQSGLALFGREYLQPTVEHLQENLELARPLLSLTSLSASRMEIAGGKPFFEPPFSFSIPQTVTYRGPTFL